MYPTQIGTWVRTVSDWTLVRLLRKGLNFLAGCVVGRHLRRYYVSIRCTIAYIPIFLDSTYLFLVLPFLSFCFSTYCPLPLPPFFFVFRAASLYYVGRVAQDWPCLIDGNGCVLDWGRGGEGHCKLQFNFGAAVRPGGFSATPNVLNRWMGGRLLLLFVRVVAGDISI